MSWLSNLSSMVRSVLDRRRADQELAQEIEHHLELEAELNQRRGLPADRARQEAIKAFGGVPRYADEVRDERGTARLDGLLQDLRFAWRSLGRQFRLSLLVVLTLGFGIGATTSLLAVLRSVLLRPLPYGDPARVAVLWSSWRGFDKTWLSYDEYEAWSSEVRSLAGVALYSDGTASLTDGDEPEQVRTTAMDRNALQVLGVNAALGRAFTAEEDRPGGPRAVMLGHELWQRRYGGDPSILGRSVSLDGEAWPVVGVVPPGFKMPADFGSGGPTQLYIPLATDAADQGGIPGPAIPPGGGNHGFLAVARLAPGATVASTNAELAAMVRKLAAQGVFAPEQNFRAFAVGVADEIAGNVRGPLLVLLGAVAVVLLIACANAAGLLLVRGEGRRREMAIRVALGAGQARLRRLLAAESTVLAGLSGALGIGFAWAGLRALRQLAPGDLPRVSEATLDPFVLTAGVVLATVAAALAGVLPAWQANRVAPADELKEGSKGSTAGQGQLKWRQALVTAEVAMAVVLAVGAGLLIRTVGNLLTIDPGYSTKGVLTMRLSTPSVWYPDSARVSTFWRELLPKVRALPGVRSAGAARLLPLATEMGDWGVQVEGYTPPPNQGAPSDWQVVIPGYFEAMGLRLREGRFLEDRDDLDRPLAMVVNQRFVELYLNGRTAVASRVRIGGRDTTRPAYQIVGVVDDVRHNTLTSEAKAQFYVTVAQFAQAPGNTRRAMSLVVRSDGDPRALIDLVRAAVRQLDPRLPISEVKTVDEIVAGSIAAPRFAMQLLGLFGFVSLLLSVVGVYGVVSHSVALRSQEFGVRAALGARPGSLLRLSLAAGLRQTALGVGLGIVGALAAARLLAGMLEGVTPADPLTYAAVGLLAGLAALAACAGPALRAAKAQPGAVLRGLGLPLIIPVTLASSSLVSTPARAQSRSEGWRSDIAFFVEQLRTQHYILRQHPLPPGLAAAAARLQRSVPQYGDQRILVELQRLASMAGDGHTYVLPVGAARVPATALPLRFYAFADGLYVVSAMAGYEPWLGHRVVRFGRTTAAAAMGAMRDVISRDNEMGIRWIGPFFLSLRGTLETVTDAVFGDSAVVTLSSRDGQTKTIRLPLVAPPRMRGIPKLGPPPQGTGVSTPPWLRRVDEAYWYEPLADGAVYFQFNQVMDMPGETLAEFSARLREALREKSGRALVVDLRHNNGGSKELLPPLLGVLRSFLDDPANGTLYVLMGRNTFSAAQVFLAEIAKMGGAVFAGESSSSRPNFVGEENGIILPWSGAMVSISNREHIQIPGDRRTSIPADVPIELTAADYFAGRDPVLDAVLRRVARGRVATRGSRGTP